MCTVWLTENSSPLFASQKRGVFIFKVFVLLVFTMVEFQNYMEYLLEENWIIDFLFKTQQREI